MAEPVEQSVPGLNESLSQPAQLLGWRTLRGPNGERYAFAVLDADGELPQAGAVYCLANRTTHANGICSTELLRIGQTDNLAAFSAQIRATRAPRFNAVCVYLEDREFVRRMIVREMATQLHLTTNTPDRHRRYSY